MEFIVFLLCVTVIVLIINIKLLSSKCKKYEEELQNVRVHSQKLDEKLNFLYSIMKNKGDVPGVSPNKDQKEKRHEKAVVQDAGVTLTKEAENAPEAVAPVRVIPPVQAAQEAAPVHQAQPVRPAAASSPYGTPVRRDPTPLPKQKKHIEEWLGARLFNLAAALLIFIGLIMFCTLSPDIVSNTMKMTAMFAVSGGFIGVGAYLARRDRSIFPLGMLGTGFGSFFISILLSHVYFHSLGEIPAFGLILIWSALALFLSKKLNSIMLSVTAHIGTAISICFAFSAGFTAEKVVILTVYQFAAIAVIILGNIFCCRKTYRFGLIMTQCLLLYTSIAMSVAFSEKFIMPKSISAPAAIVIYAVQFLAVSFVSYLVSTSAATLEKEGGSLVSASKVIHTANKLLWLGGMLSTVGFITYHLCIHAFNSDEIIPTTTAIAIAALLHLGLTVLMEEKLSFSVQLSTISMWFLSAAITITLIVGAHTIGMPFLFLYALLLIGLFKLTKNTGLDYIAATVLCVEAVYMCLYGYFVIENVWISIPYMAAIGAVLLLLWFVQDGRHKQHYFKYMKIAEYLWISASIIPINASEFSSISIPLIISEFAFMNIVCYLIKFGSEKEPELQLVVKAESLLTVYIGIFSLAFEYSESLGDNAVIKAVLCIMVFILTLIYFFEFARSDKAVLQAVAAATVSGYIMSLAIGFRDYFRLFEYLVETLHCIPFLFIYSAILIAIYVITHNRKLTSFIRPGLILDMFFMVIFGYGDLIGEAYSYTDNSLNLGLHIVFVGIALAHASADLGLSFLLCGDSEITSSGNKIDIQRYVSYFWINIAFPTIAFLALYKTGMDDYKWVFSMMILTAVNTAVYALGYQGKFGTPFNYAVRIVSAIAFYMALPSISNSHSGNGRYAASIVLMIVCAALFFAKSRDLLKHERSKWVQVYIGINSTIFVNAACSGVTSAFNFAYIFSIVTMAAALVCILVGFITKAKGIRVYGLVVTMLCIIKLVTIDISGADSLARVISFIVGGIICFIISGIYNRMEKHFIAQETVPVMQAVPADGAPIQQAVNAIFAPINAPQTAPENQPSVTENITETTVAADAYAKQDDTPTEALNSTENNDQ